MLPDTIAGDWSTDLATQRKMMVDCQVRTFDVTDQALLAAMLDVPREPFVAPAYAALAYADAALPSAGGRILLPPMIAARLLQAAGLADARNALDVGGGSGYSAALMARMVAAVVALESDAGQTAATQTVLAVPGGKVTCVTGALDRGYAAAAPYDVILLNGAFERTPSDLLAQLAEGGRLVGIDASTGAPKAVRFERTGGDFSMRPLFDATAPVFAELRRVPAFVF